MLTQYGTAFKELYDKNQLRANIISPVCVAVTTLESVIPASFSNKFHQVLSKTQQHLTPILEREGEAYNRMSNGEKLEFVKHLENHILTILEFLGEGNTAKSSRSILIT